MCSKLSFLRTANTFFVYILHLTIYFLYIHDKSIEVICSCSIDIIAKIQL